MEGGFGDPCGLEVRTSTGAFVDWMAAARRSRSRAVKPELLSFLSLGGMVGRGVWCGVGGKLDCSRVVWS